MTIEENKQIVRRAFGALVDGDLSPLGDILTPNAVIHQCGFPEPIPARALAGGEVRSPAGFIAERQLRIEHLIGEGDVVALHWTGTGRYAAPDEPELDGRPISVPWMTFVRIDGGKIAEIWNIRDTSTLETQLREPVFQGGS